MLLEFDPAKKARNIRERGISFPEDRRKSYGEHRLRVLAHIDGRLHAAVITPRGERTRVISLRRANKREERTYAQERQSA